MKSKIILLIALFGLFITPLNHTASAETTTKKKILVVSSYDREYDWSKETNTGFCSAMINFGYFDDQSQADEFTKKDYVETFKCIAKKLWMDTKKKKSKEEQANATLEITKIAKDFQPDIILLGDDNAADYIGNQFLDTKIPVVFWGVNNTPVKYGLIDSIEKPGHNVTGIYQSGYYAESLQLLKTIIPKAETFAVLVDNTTSGRTHYKAVEHLDRKGFLPLKLIETVSTGSYEEWQTKALELQKKVDAFYIPQYSGLKDKDGNSVSNKEIAKWYLTNIKIPEASKAQFVREGLLCCADDAGFNQGYEAVVIANDILANGKDPSTYPPHTPKRGNLMVNTERAKMLGITLSKEMGIEEYINKEEVLVPSTGKVKIFVVSSYHREYLWSKDTNDGFCDAMLKFGYFDNKEQVNAFTNNDYSESSKSVIKKMWMDTKRKNSKSDIADVSMNIIKEIKIFKPDIVFLGDDNAANYIGNQLLNTKIPVIFWGVNNTPLKYGLVETADKPGHNVTGVYQSGYYIESVMLLKKIIPDIKTFAILSDKTPTSISHVKKIQYFVREGKIPFELVETVMTNDYELWKSKALELQKKVDFFFMAHYAGLKSKTGEPLLTFEAPKWYLANINIPEVVNQSQFVKEGLLCCADDSAYNQAFEAAVIANDILAKGSDPKTYPCRAPKRGKLMVNSQRAKMLGITLTKDMGIEEYIEDIPFLEKKEEKSEE